MIFYYRQIKTGLFAHDVCNSHNGPNKEGFIDWLDSVREFNARFGYSFHPVPLPCVKRLFGSTNWIGSKNWVVI